MKFVAKTFYGLEQIVAGELVSLGANDVTVANRAVLFTGEKSLLYKVNYMSRSALSFLLEISSFSIRSADDLYRGILKISWERYMRSEDTFSIVPVVKSEIFHHTGYAALKAKDAVADYFRNKSGKRPSVNTSDPNVLVNLHISHNSVTVSLDSSVIPLYKRGYRKETGNAPLNETLAAGMLLLSGWNPGINLIDPMCGSGTIAIEAGLIACRIPPGKFREFYGFQKWRDYDPGLYNVISERCDKQITALGEIRIFCSDISSRAVSITSNNIRQAGLGNFINSKVSDFRDLRPAVSDGFLVMNPPYGERISQGETNELYGLIGNTLKHYFEGFTAWIISSNRESLKHIGLKPSEKHTLFNGSLECLFEKFELYPGSRKRS